MDMYELLGKVSPEKLGKQLGSRFKTCRKQKKVTQLELSKKTLIPLGTIRYFEQTGKVNLITLLTLCDALDLMSDFDNVLIPDNHLSYEVLSHGR